MSEKPLILWDGECGFCRRCIGWVRTKDTQKVFADSPYQAAPTPPMTPELRAACEKAVHLALPNGTVFRAARAALYILSKIGYPAVSRILLLPPFLWFAEIGYKIVASHRDFFANFFFRKEPDDLSKSH